MKITKVCNQYRVIENVDGVQTQHYRHTYEQAETVCDEIIARQSERAAPWALRAIKRKTASARSADLPVGVRDCETTVNNKNGSIRKDTYIALVSRASGKSHKITRAYGKGRTRAEAVALVIKLGTEHAEKYADTKIALRKN